MTGFDDRNLLVAPFQPQMFTPVEIVQHHINQNSRNVPAPVGRFTASGTDVTTAFLFLPVHDQEFPSIELQQSGDRNGLSLKIRTEREDIHVLIKPAFEVVFSATAAKSVREVTRVCDPLENTIASTVLAALPRRADIFAETNALPWS